MSEILDFPASLELYSAFDTLFVCFHGLMNTKIFSKVGFLKTGILKNSKVFLSKNVREHSAFMYVLAFFCSGFLRSGCFDVFCWRIYTLLHMPHRLTDL